MREIGGYIELDEYTLPMLHEGAIALNCGRNTLEYLIKAKGIKKICIPKFMCSSVIGVCRRVGITTRYYSISLDFMPKDIDLDDDEWIYVVNYYGQLNNETIKQLKIKYERIIVDNAQAYYQMPVEGIDTLYTCRKFFGVPDGAFLYTDEIIKEDIGQDESFERMKFLLGRYERTASEFYKEYVDNNEMFINEPIKRMSKLTYNLLHGIDYELIKRKRHNNFKILHEELKEINKLNLSIPDGAFMYPLYIENGYIIRQILQKEKVYIPTLWPDVFDICEDTEIEYDMARNILPLPVDQRYNEEDMKYVISLIKKSLGE